MRTRALAVVLVSVLAGGLAPVSPAHAAAVTKIMVVGDSISQGSSGDWTWRYRLAKHLTAAGAAYDLVGPRTDLFDRVTGAHGSQQYMDGTFDKQHAAKWGEMIGFAKERIAADVTSSGAQLLLVHLGINDLAWGGTATDAEASLRGFITNARSANPNLRMIFGAVLPNETAVNDANLRGKINDYNARLAAVAAEQTKPDSPINVLGTAPGWNPIADTYDGTHPNPRGEYKIAANYANGLSTYAGIGRAFGTIPSVPLFGAPASLTATPGNSQATLAWSAVAGATGYYVWQRDATAGQAWVQLPYPLATTSWTATMLTAGDTWEYRIQPVRVRDLGGFSPTASVVPTGTKPTTPTGLTATSRDGEAVLSWTEVSGATGYYIYQRDATANAAWQRLPYPVEGSPWTASLLANGRTYEYRVTAANANGESGFSNLVSVIPRGPTPGTPSNLTATPGNAQVRLCWKAASGATGYVIYQKDATAGQDWTRLPYPVSGTCFTAGLLTNNHWWHFAVTAVNANGESGFSNVVQTMPVPPAPAAPTGLTATGGEGTARLCWTPSSGATGYVVYQRDVTAGQGFTRLPYPVPGNCWTAEMLTSGHTYQYRLRAAGAGGESGYSATVSVTPQVIRPVKPGQVVAVARPGQVELAWERSDNANNYHLYVKQFPFDTWVLVNWNIPGTSVTFIGGDEDFEFKVVAVRWGVEGGFEEAPLPVRPLHNTYGGGNVGWFPSGQCTAYAQFMLYRNTGKWLMNKGTTPPYYWNAETWDEAARDEGYLVDRNAEVGAIAQWEQGWNFGGGYGTAGSPGHVGVVAQTYVDFAENRHIVVMDYNRASALGWGYMDYLQTTSDARYIHF